MHNANHNDNEAATMAELETENRRLRSSLEKCQAMVEDCRTKLAAKTDTAAPSAESERRHGG